MDEIERKRIQEIQQLRKNCESFSKTIEKHLKNKKPNDANTTYQDFVRYWQKINKDKEITFVLGKESKILVATDNYLRSLFNKHKVKIV